MISLSINNETILKQRSLKPKPFHFFNSFLDISGSFSGTYKPPSEAKPFSMAVSKLTGLPPPLLLIYFNILS